MRLEAATRQLALDLPPSEGMAFADFVEASSNRAALRAMLAWPEWPSALVILSGRADSGKTHLARIWCRRSGALFLPALELWRVMDPLARLGSRRACVVDGIDAEDGSLDEELLLHLFNILQARAGFLLITTRTPLGAWRLRLADLRSRLRTGWMITIEPPGDGLLAALLNKQLKDRGLHLDQRLLAYCIARMERSSAGARRLAALLDRLSLCAGRPLTLPLVRLALEHEAALADERSKGAPHLAIADTDSMEDVLWISD